jgi:hypothetical protein
MREFAYGDISHIPQNLSSRFFLWDDFLRWLRVAKEKNAGKQESSPSPARKS